MANEQNLKHFKKGQSGNPNGRPVRLFSEIASDWRARGIERATPERVVEVFEYLLALPADELKSLANGKGGDSVPAIIQISAEEMTGKRKREILSDMLDRAHGKATQRTELSGKDGAGIEVSITDHLSLDEQRAILKAIKAQKKADNGASANESGNAQTNA